VIWHITLRSCDPPFSVHLPWPFSCPLKTSTPPCFWWGHEATLPINLYLQVRDGSTPVINAISFLLIVGHLAAGGDQFGLQP
jgi:spermidine/putrescine transport system permease protein